MFTTQGTEYYPIIIRNSDSKIGLYNTGLYSQTIINQNTWFFICSSSGKINGSSISKLYVNGKLENTTTQERTISGNFILGKNYISSTEYYKGIIDDFRVHQVTLSLSQIKQNYVAGLNSLLNIGSISKEEYNERINTLAYNY